MDEGSTDGTRHKRSFFRVPLNRAGTIRHGSEHASCDVLDITEQGVHLRTPFPCALGDTLHLSFPLSETCLIVCTVLVIHASAPDVGGRIISIPQDSEHHLSTYIEQLIAISLTGF